MNSLLRDLLWAARCLDGKWGLTFFGYCEEMYPDRDDLVTTHAVNVANNLSAWVETPKMLELFRKHGAAVVIDGSENTQGLEWLCIAESCGARFTDEQILAIVGYDYSKFPEGTVDT